MQEFYTALGVWGDSSCVLMQYSNPAWCCSVPRCSIRLSGFITMLAESRYPRLFCLLTFSVAFRTAGMNTHRLQAQEHVWLKVHISIIAIHIYKSHMWQRDISVTLEITCTWSTMPHLDQWNALLWLHYSLFWTDDDMMIVITLSSVT